MTDGPEDERCTECGRLDPSNCPCPTEEAHDFSFTDLLDAVLELRRRGFTVTPPPPARRGHLCSYTYDAGVWSCTDPACPKETAQ